LQQQCWPQRCCCKNFLKVLKPISMKSAKIQKATLDPLKISGRCGRLMCCLRYEDATYEELRKRLPKNKTRVGTPEGPGIVVDSKILVQLVLVQLDAPDGGYGREIAVPVEDLMDPDACPKPGEVAESDPLRGMSARKVRAKVAGARDEKLAKQDRYRDKTGGPAPAAAPVGAPSAAPRDGADGAAASSADGSAPTKKKRRRKRKKGGAAGAADASARPGDAGLDAGPDAGFDAGSGGDAESADDASTDGTDGGQRPEADSSPESSGAGEPGEGGRRRRRRRRRKGRGQADGGSPEGGSGEGGGPAGGPPSGSDG
jgi:hypothetical protein